MTLPESQSQPSNKPLPRAVAFPHFRPVELLSAALLVLFTAAFIFSSAVVAREHTLFSDDLLYLRHLYRFYLVLLGTFVAVWALQPYGAAGLAWLGLNTSASVRRLVTSLALAFACLFTCAFLVHFGRQQYGGWDQNIVVDVAWRQLSGQRPFLDFVTPTPPAFNWSAALAFRLFGVRWDAMLYISGLFASGTLLWFYFLLRQLGLRTFASLGTAFLVEAAAMLTSCFWWYNNTTLVLAAIFYLATLLLVHKPSSRLAQISYVLLLGVLPLTKPNIAGVTVAGSVLLLLVSTSNRSRILLLTVAGSVLSALLFAALRIPLPAMIATYRGIARERGGLSAFGFYELTIGEQRLTVLWLAVLCAVLCSGFLPLFRSVFKTRGRSLAFALFFPLSAVVAIYGVAGNGELRDVDCTLLICAIACLYFSRWQPSRRVTRIAVALLWAMCASDLYVGATRMRIHTIGPHLFFEWRDHDHRFQTGFFSNLRASETLVEVDNEIRQALHGDNGSVFFGPRVDFEYAALNKPSPTHWVTFFQPGTSFGREETNGLVNAWTAHRFDTLIFLKGDYIFYPESLLQQIKTDYIRDDRYPRLSVYRRRTGR